MRILQHRRPTAGFTLVELLTVMAVIGLLAALLLPSLHLGKDRAKRLVCVNEEREQGVSFHMFAHEHNSRFPMAVPADDGGSEEYVQNGQSLGGQFYFSYRNFQVLSSYSEVPPELICPADTRQAAASMEVLNNANLSYFVGVTANYNEPESILTGDRNVTRYAGPASIQQLQADGRLYWTEEMHRYRGDVLFADGHVELWNQINLAMDLANRNAGAVFFLPSVSQAGSAAGGGGRRATPAPRAEAGGSSGSSASDNGVPAGVGDGGGSSRQPGPSIPDPRGPAPTVSAPTPQVVPLPPAENSAGAGLAAGDGSGSAKDGVARPTSGLKGLGAIVASGTWFWLFLAALVAAAEMGRRLWKGKQAGR